MLFLLRLQHKGHLMVPLLLLYGEKCQIREYLTKVFGFKCNKSINNCPQLLVCIVLNKDTFFIRKVDLII